MRAMALAAIVAGCGAAELVVRDLRLAVGGRPSEFDFTYAGSGANASGSDSFEGGLGLELGGRWSWARPGDALGVVAGADLIVDAQSYGGSDGLATTWGRASGGAGWALDDRTTLTAEVGLQYGVSALSLPGTASAPAFEATGTAMGYDLRVGATWLATRSFGFGVHAGWLIASHDLSGDAEVTIDQAGLFVGLELVWRFTDAPPRLE
jgi:hypothetical protein